MSDRGGEFYSFLGGLLFGAVVGGVMGILFAPKAGEETRRDIKEKAEEVYDTGSKRAQELYEKGKTAYEEQLGTVTEAFSAGKEALAEKGEELREKMEETASKMREKTVPPKPAAEGGTKKK
jgi:gas vesicle protein